MREANDEILHEEISLVKAVSADTAFCGRLENRVNVFVFTRRVRVR